MNTHYSANQVKNWAHRNQKNIIHYSVCFIVALMLWFIFKIMENSFHMGSYGIEGMIVTTGIILGAIAGYIFSVCKFPVRFYVATIFFLTIFVFISYGQEKGKAMFCISLSFFFVMFFGWKTIEHQKAYLKKK